MARRKRSVEKDPKTEALRASGALHPHPESVRDEGFSKAGFFDPRDRVQVKYEMLRRHRVEGRPVTEAAASFGVSRQAFYLADAVFTKEGIPGLVPKPRGPKRAHKCTETILEFVQRWRAGEAEGKSADLQDEIKRRFGVTIHPRSIDRALARRKKKRQRTKPA